jgi:hypothetical protein
MATTGGRATRRVAAKNKKPVTNSPSKTDLLLKDTSNVPLPRRAKRARVDDGLRALAKASTPQKKANQNQNQVREYIIYTSTMTKMAFKKFLVFIFNLGPEIEGSTETDRLCLWLNLKDFFFFQFREKKVHLNVSPFKYAYEDSGLFFYTGCVSVSNPISTFSCAASFFPK